MKNVTAPEVRTTSLFNQSVSSVREKFYMQSLLTEVIVNMETRRSLMNWALGLSAILTLSAALSTTACFANVQDDFVAAQHAVENQDYDKAFKSFTRLSKKGLSGAYWQLGYLYEHGLGTKPDKEMAKQMYIQSVLMSSSNKTAIDESSKIPPRVKLEQSKDDNDRLLLAHCYEVGIGGSKDYKKAIEIYEQLSERNNPEALNILGSMYQNGLGVRQDLSKAAALYARAADANSAMGANNLGYLYLTGLGVERDYKKAAALFEKAAQREQPAAISNLGWMYLHGYGVRHDYDRAIALFAEAASHGLPAARLNLGYMLQYGLGVPNNPGDSERLYVQADAQVTSADKLSASRQNTMSFAGKSTAMAVIDGNKSQ